MGAISELHSFNTLALRPSGPGALCIFKPFNSLRPYGVNGLVPLYGISESDSRVKTDSNCLLQMFALSKVSVFKIPCSLSEVIPNASFFRDLTNDQNFFTFSFFLGQSGSGLSVSK